MKSNHCRIHTLTLVAFLLTLTTAWAVDTQTTLYTFQGVHTGKADGANPHGGLIADSAGNLYGTTYWGGGCAGFIQGCGTVYELSPKSGGGYTKTTLYTFTGTTDGNSPAGNLALDASGNLYGTADYGGTLGGNCTYGCGVVYELSPNSSGGWTQTVLYDFPGGTGPQYPLGGVVFDPSGNLYGTSFVGGTDSSSGGTVFELSPSSSGWSETTLHSFAISSGIYPYSGVILDVAGNLYGTASQGGSNTGECTSGGCGVVYRLSKTQTGWRYGLLYTFQGPRGLQPHEGLVMDAAGNLYGTTAFGGNNEEGVVFELTPTAQGQWKQTVLHNFTGGSDGIAPNALTTDAAGNIYGTSSAKALSVAAAFKLTPATSGGWQFQILCTLANGGTYTAPLLRDALGNMFGASYSGGPQQVGTVYELSPVTTVVK